MRTGQYSRRLSTDGFKIFGYENGYRNKNGQRLPVRLRVGGISDRPGAGRGVAQTGLSRVLHSQATGQRRQNHNGICFLQELCHRENPDFLATAGRAVSFPKKRLRSGFARVEFLAVRQEIEDLISKGYSIKTVHEMLQKDGKISMSYDAFRRFVTGKTSAAVLAGARTQNHVTDSKAKSAALDKSHPRPSPGEGP